MSVPEESPGPRGVESSPPGFSDPELVARAKAGDYEAFETLVKRHDRRLYGLAMGILRNPQDAEEVVQNALLSALENLEGFRGEAAFGTWIVRIATHAALKVLRKRRGLVTVSLEAATEPGEDGEIPHPEYIADWRGDPAGDAERSEVREHLERAVGELTEGQRAVFLLRDVEGFSVRETAEALGISQSNVKVRLLRARLKLREVLTRVFGDPTRVFEPHDHDAELEPGGDDR